MLKLTCENVIKSQKYDETVMRRRLDKFRKAGLLTEEEYLELVEMMVDYPPIE